MPAAHHHETVTVDLEDRSYDIVIGSEILAQAGSLVLPVLKRKAVTIITDENVAPLHLETVTRSFEDVGIKTDAIILAAGEQTKSFAELEKILNQLLETGLERKSTLVALGGGVIGDLTGFAAAIALRGIDFIQIPTTLLSQVDSSVGGKTGINVPKGKNLVGAFYQPQMVLADVGALDTLPKRELLAGYAEVVKYGLIDDPDFFTWLESHGPDLIDGDRAARIYAVKKSCEAKASIVSRDEREGGVRALLNLGHTFGHALESACGYGSLLVHGEAVAIGMTMAFELSTQMALAPQSDAARLHRHLAQVGLPTSPLAIPGMAWDCDDLIARMGSDKKVADGKLTFILARGIGQSFITQDVPVAALRFMLEQAITE